RPWHRLICMTTAALPGRTHSAWPRDGVVRALAPLDLSALALAALGGAVAVGAARASTVSAAALATLGMYYFGFVHFAVGYHFFARSAATRTLARRTPLGMAVGLAACAMASVPFYTSVLAPVVYTSVFVHFAENGLYLALKRDGRTETEGGGILPVLFVLATARMAGVLLHVPAQAALHLSVAAALLAVYRFRTGAPDWRAGWAVGGRCWVLVLGLALVGLLVPDTSLGWPLFAYWHFATWFLHQWRTRPETRARLAWSHAAFGVVYFLLVIGSFGRWAVLPGAAAFALVSPFAYQAQSMLHVLVTLVFRAPGVRPAHLGSLLER
ncbi:MAG: hypothetical protein ACREQL_09480, partial [Candidatus Binatia bacterium]